MSKIHTLHDISLSLLKSTNIVELAGMVTPEALRQAADQLFENLGLTTIENKFDAPGFEQAKALLSQIDAAKMAFSNGEKTAIRVTTEHADNDANGNDHTSVNFTFNTGEQQVFLSVALVQIHDDGGWRTELSYLDELHQFILNGEPVSEQLSDALQEALEPISVRIVDGEFDFTNYETSEEVNNARALIAKYQPLLDMAANIAA